MTPARTPPNPNETVHYQSARKKRRGQGGGMTVNMTPMIDVTFLLLIFFIVATNFARQEGILESKLPEAAPPSAAPPVPPLTIRLAPTLTESGTGVSVRVNNVEPVVQVGGETLRGLPALDHYLRNVMHLQYDPKKTTVVIDPNNSTPWEYVLTAYNHTLRGEYGQIQWQLKRGQ
jgi:biopolymer transport protein ExbD